MKFVQTEEGCTFISPEHLSSCTKYFKICDRTHSCSLYNHQNLWTNVLCTKICMSQFETSCMV